MAHANRLTEQVKILTKRVHELESALASRGQYRPEDHSRVDNVSAEDWTQEIQGVSDTIGTLSIGVNGQIKYHGESAGSEVSDAKWCYDKSLKCFLLCGSTSMNFCRWVFLNTSERSLAKSYHVACRRRLVPGTHAE